MTSSFSLTKVCFGMAALSGVAGCGGTEPSPMMQSSPASTIPAASSAVSSYESVPPRSLEKVETGAQKVSVSAFVMASFAAGQLPVLQHVKVNGAERLEGVTYVIQAIDERNNVVVGTLNSKDFPDGEGILTLDAKEEGLILLRAPEVKKGTKTFKGFQPDIRYEVTLKNKAGQDLWTGAFEVDRAPAPARRRRGPS